MIHFGYLDDPRLQKGIEWINRFMRFNDGVANNPQVPPYDHYEMCWGAHTCHMGVVKVLKGLSAIPMERRTDEINDTIQKATEFILTHHIYKRSHNLNRNSKPGWLKFGFPLMYQTDVLEILDILTGLGIKDSRMDDAIDIVIAKQDDIGRWKAENTYNSDRLLIPMGQKDEQNKWQRVYSEFSIGLAFSHFLAKEEVYKSLVKYRESLKKRRQIILQTYSEQQAIIQDIIHIRNTTVSTCES